ncbi:polysaccharide export protein [Pontibacter qinzhouensis]|uniref:Polysaccharide export protein n=1 Tax=Pontibacter qinzhouensis TaxID=2603253 RepID=A0A5C8JDE6_9BACT|nr:polysaccharide biosynthesis/export family protein [Pontibacter qinzhouensis]TXK36405.1 polysaccharide export protein [Pontibacter qinzhouensis]
MKAVQSLVLAVAILFSFTVTSCTNTRQAVYFNNIQESEYLDKAESLEPVIQANDLLSITVSSMNPAASEIFNVSSTTNARNASATNSISQVAGYLVDPDGYIQFPFLGRVKAAGLNKKDFQNAIKDEISQRKLLIDPIIDVRYLNYKVSVLGEVARPAVLTVPNEKLTLLEALGLAGDLTIYAKRDNILLIREEGGKKKLTRIDLTTDALFTSPYYYLKSNDIIYVEPNKTKIAGAGATRQWLPLVLSSLTLVVVSIDRLSR